MKEFVVMCGGWIDALRTVMLIWTVVDIVQHVMVTCCIVCSIITS
jgi:hypothetical protein